MVKFLAYEFPPESLVPSVLGRIVDDHFNLSGKRTPYSDFRGLCEFIDSEDGQRKLNRMKQRSGYDNSLICQLTYLLNVKLVKSQPLLEIRFIHELSQKSIYHPEHMTGLSIYAGHSGSEGLVALLDNKPMFDAYLRSIGVDFIDRSQI